jgi:hypothetical protein
LHVHLVDGHIVSVPIRWFPLLHEAAPQQWEQCEIGGGGISIRWAAIDEDPPVANLMAGVDWQTA